MKAQNRMNGGKGANQFTLSQTKEATATVLALLALMLTPLINGPILCALIAGAIVVYTLAFWRHLSVGELAAGGLAFAIALGVALVLSLI